MEPLELYPWDHYCAGMAQTDFLEGNADVVAAKSFFVREAPFGGAYALFGGLTSFLRQLSSYRFSQEVCEGLREQGFRKEWIQFLRRRKRLRIKVISHREGSVFVAHEPVVSLVGPLHDLRLAEGMLLPAVNPTSLMLTKWHRIVEEARPAGMIDFGRRRAQNAPRSTLCAYLAGCSSTSNSQIRSFFDIPLTGTMGHEYVQSHGNEYEAFDRWLRHNPAKPVLLVDTVNTLESGIPNAAAAFKKHWRRIKNAGGKPMVRIDSGDLAYLALAAIRKLNDADLAEVQIVLTNDLDEYLVASIKQQIRDNAHQFSMDAEAALSRIAAFPAGTKPATCFDQPSLGGVAKLMEIAGSACIKISDNPAKTSIPGLNTSAFVWEEDKLVGVLLYPYRFYQAGQEGLTLQLSGANITALRLLDPNDSSKAKTLTSYSLEPRQFLVYDDGFTEEWDNPCLEDIRRRVAEDTAKLHWSHKRLINPHSIKLSVLPETYELRRRMIAERVLRSDLLEQN